MFFDIEFNLTKNIFIFKHTNNDNKKFRMNLTMSHSD